MLIAILLCFLAFSCKNREDEEKSEPKVAYVSGGEAFLMLSSPGGVAFHQCKGLPTPLPPEIKTDTQLFQAFADQCALITDQAPSQITEQIITQFKSTMAGLEKVLKDKKQREEILGNIQKAMENNPPLHPDKPGQVLLMLPVAGTDLNLSFTKDMPIFDTEDHRRLRNSEFVDLQITGSTVESMLFEQLLPLIVEQSAEFIKFASRNKPAISNNIKQQSENPIILHQARSDFMRTVEIFQILAK